MMKSVLLIAIGFLVVPSVVANGEELLLEYGTDCQLQPIDKQCLLDQAVRAYCELQGMDPCDVQIQLDCVEPGGVGGPIAVGIRTLTQRNGAFVEVADSVDMSDPTKLQFERLRFIIDVDGCK